LGLINKGHNAETVEHSLLLSGYVEFVAESGVGHGMVGVYVI